ncbi:MAG: alkaline phosphatase family protein [Nitrososphaerota archaeon]|nr:alkaline phosphatase family protein [Nitrososphaerota archaeon]
MRVLVVGFDGATWELLSRYAQDGTMPRLGELCGKSKWGVLKSTIPPVTGPAWAALSTGKGPGKTGIYSFYVATDSIDRFRPTTSLDVKAETLPELLERAGLAVQVVNLPTFSFPRKIRGPVLGDVLCPPTDTVQPASLRSREPFRSYRSFPNLSLKRDTLGYLDDIRGLEDVRFRCAKELFLSKWDFMFVMFSGVDWMQHELYSDLLSGKATGGASLAREIYRDLDGYLDWFASSLGPEDYLFLVSDHGFKSYSGGFSINHWLAENGYLHTKPGPVGISRLSHGLPFAVPSGVLSAVARHRRLWEAGTRAWAAASGTSSRSEGMKPDPSTSLAASQDFTLGIRLNTKRRFRNGVLDEERERKVAGEIRSKLEGLAKRGIISGCLPAAEVYKGPYVSQAPELVVFPGERGIGGYSRTVLSEGPQNGHSMEGIYLMRGAGVEPGKGEEASICDIAPTVLTLFGLEVPDDMDGVSLWGSPKIRGSGVGSSGPGPTLTQADEKLIEERLKSLGYV